MSAALDVPGVALRAEALIALRRVALNADSDPSLANLPGGFATRRKGHGQEVADVREYVSGDDLRHLDRGTTARTGALHVRQFQEERDRVSLLVADFRPSMLWGVTRAFRSVAAAEVLVMIGWRSVEEGGRVGLLAITPEEPVVVPPRGRARGMLDVIGGLVQAHAGALRAAMAGAREDAPLVQGLSRVERIVPSGAEVLIASGFDMGGAELPDRLNALARRRVPQLVRVTDAEGARLPRGRYPIRLPDGRRTRVDLGGGTVADPMLEKIAGRMALRVDAGEGVEATARRVAAAFPPERLP